MNLASLLDRAGRSFADRPALAVGDRAVSDYRSLSGRAAVLAANLRGRLGLAAGDRVALVMKNCPEYAELMFACWHAGLTAVPVNAKLAAAEFQYILDHSGARLCFTTPDLAWLDANGGELFNLTPGSGGRATDISNTRQISGYSQGPLTPFEAFRWDEASGFQFLGTMGLAYSFGYAINESGQVVGQIKSATGNSTNLWWARTSFRAPSRRSRRPRSNRNSLAAGSSST